MNVTFTLCMYVWSHAKHSATSKIEQMVKKLKILQKTILFIQNDQRWLKQVFHMSPQHLHFKLETLAVITVF